jgi:disulfide bond formation protein DsbB
MQTLKQNGKQKTKRSFFALMTEIFSWLQIAASPFLIRLVIGFIIYISRPNRIGLIIAIIIAAVGLITGIIWAAKVWKEKGTTHFISAVMASPYFDNLNDEKE